MTTPFTAFLQSSPLRPLVPLYIVLYALYALWVLAQLAAPFFAPEPSLADLAQSSFALTRQTLEPLLFFGGSLLFYGLSCRAFRRGASVALTWSMVALFLQIVLLFVKRRSQEGPFYTDPALLVQLGVLLCFLIAFIRLNRLAPKEH